MQVHRPNGVEIVGPEPEETVLHLLQEVRDSLREVASELRSNRWSQNAWSLVVALLLAGALGLRFALTTPIGSVTTLDQHQEATTPPTPSVDLPVSVPEDPPAGQ